MAPPGPPFDFDLNELPPPEHDGVDGVPESPVPKPSAHHQDPLLTEPVQEPSPAPQDPLPLPAPVPEPTTAQVPQPARSLAPAPEEASPDDPLPAPLRAPAPEEASPDDRLPTPVRASVPVPSPQHHYLPSPVLDLEAPLSSLDDDDDEDEDEADLDLPPAPPLPLPPPPPLPPSWYRADTSDDSSGRPGDAARQYSSPDTWAPRGSRAATASDTTSSQRSRRRPYSCDDAISNQRRRVDDCDEDDGGSSRSRSGSRRGSEFGSPPRRYERPGPAPLRRYYGQQDGGRHAPAADAQPRVPARNRRRRRRAQQSPQHGYPYEGPVQKQLGRGREQPQLGFRGRERPQVHHGPQHGGPEVPKVGSYNPPSGSSFARRDASGGRLCPEQERGTGWDRRQDAPPFRPSSSSRLHGREDPYPVRQSQDQEPPKNGGYQHRGRVAPSFRPSYAGAHGGRDDGPYGGRRIPPDEKAITGGADHHQQTKAPPRGRDEQFPGRAYRPYARRGSGFDRPLDFDRPDGGGGGRNPGRREPLDSYEHGRYSKQQLRSDGPPARGLLYYGDVQE